MGCALPEERAGKAEDRAPQGRRPRSEPEANVGGPPRDGRSRAEIARTGERRSVRVGIVAVQGDVDAHAAALTRLDAEPVRVRREKDLDGLSALILPGGESTTIAMGLERLRLYEPLEAFARSGRPILGTCAGAVLLARQVENRPVRSLGLIDVVAVRNAYGTQVDSFAAEAEAEGDLEGLPCVFIRAPRLCRPGPDVQVRARVDGWPVFVEQRAVLATTFHPELTGDPRVHERLLALAPSVP